MNPRPSPPVKVVRDFFSLMLSVLLNVIHCQWLITAMRVAILWQYCCRYICHYSVIFAALIVSQALPL